MQLPEQIDTTDIRATDGLYTVLVNDEPLFTPKGHAVQVSSWDLANAMADELMAEAAVDLQGVSARCMRCMPRSTISSRTASTRLLAPFSSTCRATSSSIPILIRPWRRSSWRLGRRCWRSYVTLARAADVQAVTGRADTMGMTEACGRTSWR